MYSLYVHIFPNGKRYYGITGRDVEDRWGRNGSHYRNNERLSNAIKKYGWDNIQHIVVLTGLTKHEAGELEKLFIAKYRTTEREFGYNYAVGGEINSGWKMHHTQATRKLISDKITEWHKKPETIAKLKVALANKPPISDATREKLRTSHIGLPSGMLGKKHTLESRKKMSDAQSGKVISDWQKQRISEANSGRAVSDDTREKLRQANLGRKFSDEHRRKLSEAHKGKPSPRKGCKLSDEQKRKISETLRQKKREVLM